MDIEKMREEFEAWAITSAWLGLGEESQLHQDADGKGYNEIEVHTAWLAWQASRDAVTVIIPRGNVYSTNEAASQDDYYFDQGQADGLLKAKTAIEAAGLKVKP